jgi:beta-lactamase class A
MGIGLEQQLRELCGRIDGEWGLSLYIPERGERLSVNAQARRVSASTIKIPLLALLLKDAEEGRLDLEQPVAIDAVNRVGGSGILQSLSPTVKLSLRDHAELMMVLSDNVSTNVVIDAVGMERANAFFVQEGWTATHLGRKMMTPGRLLPDGTREQNYTSAADLGDMMERIALGTMVSPGISRTMLRMLAGQQLHKFGKALPFVERPDPREDPKPAPEGKLVLAGKGGTLTGNPNVSHDAAILLLPNGRQAVLVITTATPDNKQAEACMHQAARALYEALL